MINQPDYRNIEPLNLNFSYPFEVKENSEDKEKFVKQDQKKSKLAYNQESLLLSLPQEMIKEIFSFIQDSSTRASILETSRLFFEIGTKIFKIQDEDGTFPIVEKLMARGEKGIAVISKLLQRSSITPRYQERVILPWAIRRRHVKISQLIIGNPEFNPFASAGIFKLVSKYSEIEMVNLLLNHPRIKEKIGKQTFYEALLMACEYGNTEVVKILFEFLRKQCNVKILIENAIETAKKWHSLEIVQFLLNQSIEIDNESTKAQDKKINDAEGKQVSLYKNACSKFKVKLNKHANIYPSSIQHLMQEKGLDAISNLLEKKLSKKYKKSVLFPWASRKGIVSVIDAIFDNLRTPKLNASQDHINAIACASIFGQINVVRTILTKAQNSSFSNNDISALTNVAMETSIENGYTEIVEFLMETKPLNEYFKGKYLMLASEYGHFEIVKLLLAKGNVDPSVQENVSIIMASQNGHLEVVKLLLADKRVNPSARENASFIFASLKGKQEIINLLLADPRVNPSELAQAEMLKCLLAGSKSLVSNTAYTILLAACQSGYLEVVRVLLGDSSHLDDAINQFISMSKMSPEIAKIFFTSVRLDSSKNKETPIQIARERGHEEIVKLLSKTSS